MPTSEIVDVSKMVLTKSELKLLKRIKKCGVATLTKEEARLIFGKGLVVLVSRPQEEMFSLSLSETGERYFTYRAQISHEKLAGWARYIITTAIAVAAFIKSFFFSEIN